MQELWVAIKSALNENRDTCELEETAQSGAFTRFGLERVQIKKTAALSTVSSEMGRNNLYGSKK